MNCVKCGREIPEDQVFCETCLTDMENYPVKPGTAVHSPARPAEEELPKKPVKKKYVPTAEELLLRTRKKLRRTRIFAVVLLLICGSLSFLMAQVVLELDFQRILGQNYRTEKGTPATKPVSEWTQLVTEPTEPETEFLAPAAEEYSGVVPDAAPVPAPEPAPTETPTEATTEPATQPPTEAPPEAPTEAPTQAPTEAPAPEPTDVPVVTPTETPAPTEPPAPATEAPTEPAATAVEETPAETAGQPETEPAADAPVG